MPATKRVTLVVDVNVLVSMLINQDTTGIKGLFNKQVFRVAVSPSHLGLNAPWNGSGSAVTR